ncbi:MAG: hypothetical protein A2052_07080 [Deltaproteobacteria bacterium GWA2_54_12]|nr:MAG: hypothetical protein A2052_07080 [Deltaproteobacteria bacterium GWA2_54_12]
MDYQIFLDSVKRLQFIRTADAADAAIKAVLGILASSMNREQAEKFVSKLPEPLTIKTLRSPQARPLDITIEEFFDEIGSEFKLNTGQAKKLVDTVFRLTKDAVGEETITEVEFDMPAEVAEELEAA